MAVPDRDQRDRAIERMLRSGATAAAAPNSACVDGETLAAWSSGTLARADALQVEEHLADCARCQAVLAAFARTEPIAAAPAALWRGRRFRWLIPFATAATLVGIWTTMPQRNQPVSPVVDPGARLEAERPAAPVESVPVQPPSPGLRDESAATAAPEKPAARQEADAAPKREQKTTPPQDLFAASERKRETGPERNHEIARSEPPPAAAAPAPPASPRALEERVTVSPEARQALARATAPDIVSPGGTTRWRIVAGQIQRSTDQGQTWSQLMLPADTMITAGHSPSPSVAWFVGRAGAIFVTTDGARLDPVPFVSRLDLTSVTAIDDRQATVTTVDGRVFLTADRGNRWEFR